ncbi:E3 ubiquitin/ISG15 ligase TRIM25-like [Pygocentrus nattereri]|uniref:E3 ubiquitin/ISG15 ligase TRIM25-like n=1 Tax=Pygocentrus nattereri TaxID=42514 RepID=UPI0018916F5C|nr:E3 ubiquitin/ISG15 ligase TRIM25-like [Pygocentrus nattereri]
MAEASISVDQDQFSCPVCLDLLKDPVTTPCGHSFCMVCINGCWDQEDQRGVYSCPQCRETFTPRPVLLRNNMLAEVLEKLKKTELQAGSPALCYAGPGDVECDSCTGRKCKAIKSCLVCLASYCEAHLKPHYQSPAFKKHKLVEASKQLQEKICSKHDEVMKIYCRTDHSCICYLCKKYEPKGHDTCSPCRAEFSYSPLPLCCSLISEKTKLISESCSASDCERRRKMAEASISVVQDQFSCPVCLDLLKDPVATPCGHSYCMVCINGCWDQEDQRRIYSCPQCRETFTPRPVLRRNNMLAEVVEKLKKTELQAASPALCYAGPGDVECDSCTGRKRKAIKSCLVCLASYCEAHLKPHYQSPAFKKHKLVEASKQLQEKICPQHDKLIEIYCRTDQQMVCYLCTMDEHMGHSTVAASAERKEKQNELKEMQRKSKQRLQEKEKKLQEVKQAVKTLKSSAQAAVEDSERIFTELIRSIEKKRSEVTELIRAQEEAELSGAEELLEQLEQEIADLKRRDTELEQLSHTEDHVQFLQSFQSLCVSSGSEDSFSVTVHQHLSYDGVRKSLSDLKERLEEFCKQEFRKISPHVSAVQMISPSEPQSREDFLQYFRRLTLDPNTVNQVLRLSEENRVVTFSGNDQHYSDHPERFEYWYQVLSKESVSGRCYWEVEWSSAGYDLYISVSYKGISRKGRGNERWFGRNIQSWSLQCPPSSLSFYHNNIQTKISSSSRIGVYVDHSAGTLSFYSVSDTLTLLHTVHTTFTQPLYAGFWIDGSIGFSGGTVRLCDPK